MATKKLFVGNLSWGTTSEDLNTLFSQYGNVEEAVVITDRISGRSRGFGFVTMDADGADKAVAALDNSDFQGRPIKVNEARPQQPRY